jgi:hypothetical protein
MVGRAVLSNIHELSYAILTGQFSIFVYLMRHDADPGRILVDEDMVGPLMRTCREDIGRLAF